MCFRHVMEKRVVQANMPEMLTEPLNEEQRLLFRKVFPEIFGAPSEDVSQPAVSSTNGSRALETKENLVEMEHVAETSSVKSEPPDIVEITRNGNDEDIPIRSIAELKSMTTMLSPSIQDLLMKMNGSTQEAQCAAMEDFVVEIVNKVRSCNICCSYVL